MKIFNLKFILCWIFLIFSINSFGQSLGRNQTISAYIYNLSKHITWKDENQIKAFKISIISDDETIKKSFESLLNSTSIKGKPVIINQVSFITNIDNSTQIIYISENKKSLYFDLFDKVEKKPILIISENFQDKKFTMINLYDSPDRKILFEINKSNIQNQGLTLDDEIQLMGGTVIDVAELYRNSQSSLRETEKKLKQNEEKIDSINKLFKKFQNEIERQESLISDQKSLIESKKKLIDIQKSELETKLKESYAQNKLIEKQSFILYSQRDSLKTQMRKIKNSEKSLKNQSKELIKGNMTLINQQNEIARMDSIIVENKEELGKQSLTIIKQRQTLYLFLIVIVLIVTLALVISVMLRKNRLKNKLLNENKKKIEEINQELQSSIEEIQSTNEELHNKNDELITTLEKLKEAQDNLLQSEKMASLGVLTAGIAHEMNNPINFVYAGVNSLKKDFVDILPILDEIDKLEANDKNLVEKIEKIELLKHKNEYSEALEAIKQTIDDIKLGADRTSEIVRGLKNFSRIDKEEWQMMNVHECIDSALIILKSKYKLNIEIIKNYDFSIPEIECFPGKLNQVCVNIISNAIDAIETKGQIEIKTKLINKNIEIKIKNTGEPIKPEIMAKIFDPFFTTKKIGKGQGLGLSITYGIIEEHKGKIEVISKQDFGTEFTIQLPIRHSKI